VCPLPGKKDEAYDHCDQASAEARNAAGLPLQPVHLQDLPVLNGMGRACEGAALSSRTMRANENSGHVKEQSGRF
jgi:hypothetical protein